MLNWNDILNYINEGNPKAPNRVEKTVEEWKAILDNETFRITRQKGTEPAHSSAMCTLFEPGKYACQCCQTPLFDATEKFNSGTGWPSFTQPIEPENIAYIKDESFGMTRIEVQCNICDAHLGHVFPDGPAPSGLRYCINAAALQKIKVK
ncbi:MAG: peptide-methionine (R)-S-oxide reductase MsrB [Chitinophagaceae bacterium]